MKLTKTNPTVPGLALTVMLAAVLAPVAEVAARLQELPLARATPGGVAFGLVGNRGEIGSSVTSGESGVRIAGLKAKMTSETKSVVDRRTP